MSDISAEDEKFDALIDSATELREFGKQYESRNSQYDELFRKDPLELANIEQIDYLINKADGGESLKEALIYSTLTPRFLQNIITFSNTASPSVECQQQLKSIIPFVILARINSVLREGKPEIIESCFTELNALLATDPTLAANLKNYRSPTGEALEDVLMQFNIEKHINKIKQEQSIIELPNKEQRVEAILQRIQPMRDFSLKLKLGATQREKYFKQVYDRIQDIHIDQYGEQAKLEAARKHILEVTLGTYASMYGQDGCLTDAWYQRYMREIIAGKVGQKSKKTQLLSVKSAEESALSGGEYEEHLKETQKQLDKELAKHRVTGTVAGIEIPALSAHSDELPTSIIRGARGYYIIAMRGGRGRNSVPFLIAQGNYGDITMAADPLFGFAIANKKEVPTNKLAPKNIRQRWLVTRAEMQAKAGPRFKGMRNKFADSSSIEEWRNETRLTIQMGQAVDSMFRKKSRINLNALPKGVEDKFRGIVSDSSYIKAYTMQKYIKGEELAASIKEDNAKYDLDAYEKWLSARKDQDLYKRKLEKFQQEKAKQAPNLSRLLLADEEYLGYLQLEADDKVVLAAVAKYEAWLRIDPKRAAALIDFSSRSPFARLLMLLADTSFKSQLVDDERSKLIQIVKRNTAVRLKQASAVTRGLVKFHMDGYVHGDIKARNFMESAGEFRPIDFGTSGKARSDETSTMKIDTFMGMTANLIPPEAIAGEVDKKGRRIFTPTKASDVYQMAAVCFNYSNTAAFAKVNMERFICSPRLMGFISGKGKAIYIEYLDANRSTLNSAEQQACKQAYIDFISGKITLKSKVVISRGAVNQYGAKDTRDEIKWEINSPYRLSPTATEFLTKIANLVGDTTQYIAQVKTRAALVAKKGDRDNLMPVINAGTKLDRYGRHVDNIIDATNADMVKQHIALDVPNMGGDYTRTPASDDEGSGFELYDAIKLLATLEPDKYGELLQRIQALVQQSLNRDPRQRLSAKKFHAEIKSIERRFAILQDPECELAKLEQEAQEIKAILAQFAGKDIDKERLSAQLLAKIMTHSSVTNKNLLQSLLLHLLDDSAQDQAFLREILQNLPHTEEEDETSELYQAIINDNENILLEMLNSGKAGLAEKLLHFFNQEMVDNNLIKKLVLAAAQNGEFDFILILEEYNQEFPWQEVLLEKIADGQKSVLDFCLEQGNLAAFKKFLPFIVVRMQRTDRGFKELLGNIARTASDDGFINAVVAESKLSINTFVNQFFPEIANNGMSCLAEFFLYDENFAEKIIANLNPAMVEMFFSKQPQAPMSTAMLAFVGNNTEIMKKVFGFALQHNKVEELKYLDSNGNEVTFFDHILANNNMEMFEYVVAKLNNKPQLLFEMLTNNKRKSNCMLGLITSADSLFFAENQEIFSQCATKLSAISNDEAQREFYLHTLGARAFAIAFSLGKLEIVHELYKNYEKLGIKDEIFNKLFGLDPVGVYNPEHAEIRDYFLRSQPFHTLLQEHSEQDLELLRDLFTTVKAAQDSACMDTVINTLIQEENPFFAIEQDFDSSEFLYDILVSPSISPDTVNQILLHNVAEDLSFAGALLQQPLLASKVAAINAAMEPLDKRIEQAHERLDAAEEQVKSSQEEVAELSDAAAKQFNRLERAKSAVISIHERLDDLRSQLTPASEIRQLSIIEGQSKKFVNKQITALIREQEKLLPAAAKKVEGAQQILASANKALQRAEKKLAKAASSREKLIAEFEPLQEQQDKLAAELSELKLNAGQLASAALTNTDLLTAVGNASSAKNQPAAVAAMYKMLAEANKPIEALMLLLETIKFAYKSPEYAQFHREWMQAKLKHTIEKLLAQKARYESIYGEGILAEKFGLVFAIYDANNNCSDPLPWQQLMDGTLNLDAINQQLQQAKSFVNRIIRLIAKVKNIADNGFISDIQAWQQVIVDLTMDGRTINHLSAKEVEEIKTAIANLLVIQDPATTLAALMGADFAAASIPDIITKIYNEKAKVMAKHAGHDIYSIFTEVDSANAAYDYAAAILRYANNHNQHASNLLLSTREDSPLREIMFAEIEKLPYPAAITRDLDLLQQQFITITKKRC